MTGLSIEATLELWASSLRAVKARIRPLFTQQRVAASAGLFLDGLLGDERRKTGWMRAESAGDPGPWRQQAILGRGIASSHSGGALGMIPSDTRVFLAAQPVDFRKGPDGLLSMVRDAGSDPFNGSLYVFRAKRADRIKIVWFDGSGVCLFAKRLEKSSFCWPKIGAVRIRLNSVQLAALVDGLDWKRVRPTEVRRPSSAG